MHIIFVHNRLQHRYDLKNHTISIHHFFHHSTAINIQTENISTRIENIFQSIKLKQSTPIKKTHQPARKKPSHNTSTTRGHISNIAETRAEHTPEQINIYKNITVLWATTDERTNITFVIREFSGRSSCATNLHYLQLMQYLCAFISGRLRTINHRKQDESGRRLSSRVDHL